MKRIWVLAFAICLISVASASTINVPKDFSSIQEAINAAKDGDAIVVNGYYKENIVVNKPVILIGRDATIDGQKKGDVVKIVADGVSISGFEIKNGGDRKAGIYVKSNGNKISNNRILNNYIGIKVEGKNNVIKNNKILNNRFGIYLWLARGNKIFLNEFSNQINVLSLGSRNTWNSSAIDYYYKGRLLKGYLGNHYDDYIGHDLNDDGIGDIPYVMGLDRDTHPLIKPVETYFANENGGKDENKPPIADFTAPESAYVNEKVEFNATKSYDPDGSITKYIWNIDDKTFYGKAISYVFKDPGLYVVKLTVVDDKNGTSTTTKSIRIMTAANNPAIVVVAPKKVTGKTFDISIVARNTTNLGGFMMKLDYDQDVVKLISVKGGSALPESRYFTALRGENYVKIVSIFHNDKIDGGEIAKLTFNVNTTGIARFEIKGIAATPDFDPINVEWIGAEVNI